ncbi:MAG: TadG family pilus assembly protein [Hyphomicrobiaceae bacterium]|nr:TadG family pilus assembly protein [Hyphomicrobiaceae bacterium]
MTCRSGCSRACCRCLGGRSNASQPSSGEDTEMKPNGHPSRPRGHGIVRRWRADKSGNVAIMFAASLPVLFATAAIGVDAGYLFTERRSAQGAVDLAAIAAAADLGNAEAAARATLTANDVGDIQSLIVTRGRYVADPGRHHTERFEPGVAPFNAVAVELATQRPYFFARTFLSGEADITVRSIGVSSSAATFSVGSRLLALRGGLANKLLEALIGGSIELSVMDYEALANADISLGDQLDALAGEVGITAGTYDDVLDAHVTVRDWLRAAAAVSGRNGDSAAQAALEVLANGTMAGSLVLPLDQMIALGPFGALAIGQPSQGLGATFNALELLTTSAQVANGDRQVALDLGASVPGIASLRLELAIGERPQYGTWAAAGLPQATVYTAQTRVRLLAEVGGGSVLPGVSVRLPIAIDIAQARARLESTTCEDVGAGQAGATIAATPGIVTAWIGETGLHWGDLDAPAQVTAARIVSLPLLRVYGSAVVEATNTSATMLTFSAEDIRDKTIKRAQTTDALETLASSLVENLSLRVEAGPLNLGLPGGLLAGLGTILGTAARPLDDVVQTVLQTLGVSLGEADVRVHEARCGAGALAG